MKISIVELQEQVHRPLFKVTLSNVLYSSSTFLVTATLPYLLSKIFENTIYVIQMVMFLTTILQSTLHLTFYYFYKISFTKAKQLFILLSFLLLICLGIFSIYEDNILIRLLNLNDRSHIEQISFCFAAVCSAIYSYNKALNLASKSYMRMILASLIVVVIRLLFLVAISVLRLEELSLVIVGVFIFPFFLDIFDYICELYRSLQNLILDWGFIQQFMTYAFQIAMLSALSLIAGNIFLIRVRTVDSAFTAAVAFSMGFMGVLSLLYSSLSSYFTVSLDKEKSEGLRSYLMRLSHFLPKYSLLALLLCCGVACTLRIIYPHFDWIYSIVAFFTLLRVAINSYVGLYTLLSQVLNLLKIEILVNVLRMSLVFTLCEYWQPDSLVLWYIVVLLAQTLPDFLMVLIIFNRLGKK